MKPSLPGNGRPPPLTRWQAPSERPQEAGVYMREGRAGPYACWDGVRWRAGAESPAAAACEPGSAASTPARWRGLARPSGLSCPTCRGQTVLDHGVDAETGADVIHECPDC